jgi:hypothetical protein
MAHEEDDYWTSFYIRHEAIGTIGDIEETINGFQRVVDRSMKQDLKLFVNLSSLIYLNELDRTFLLESVGDCFIGIFNGKVTGIMEIVMYKAIMDMDDLNRSGKQMYVANYLLCNKNPRKLSVLDDVDEMVLEYFTIFNTLIERVEEVVKEIEFDDYEPPVPRASREKHISSAFGF